MLGTEPGPLHKASLQRLTSNPVDENPENVVLTETKKDRQTDKTDPISSASYLYTEYLLHSAQPSETLITVTEDHIGELRASVCFCNNGHSNNTVSKSPQHLSMPHSQPLLSMLHNMFPQMDPLALIQTRALYATGVIITCVESRPAVLESLSDLDAHKCL